MNDQTTPSATDDPLLQVGSNGGLGLPPKRGTVDYAEWLGDKLHNTNDYGKEAAALLVKQAQDIKRLREALERAVLALETHQDTIACWGAYASEYFRHKHDLHGDIESIRVAAVAARNALKA